MQEENPNIFSAIKKGVKTSEFWLILAAFGLAVFFVLRGAEARQVLLVDAPAVAYAWLRTHLKTKVRAVETACTENLIRRAIMSSVPNTNIPDSITSAVTGAADNAITNALGKVTALQPFQPQANQAAVAVVALLAVVANHYLQTWLTKLLGGVTTAATTPAAPAPTPTPTATA